MRIPTTLDCIHCGLCLNACPTYRLTGREDQSPRGRVHLMRAVEEERIPVDAAHAEALESCLVCRNCESACPAGVEFGALMESARTQLPKGGTLARLLRWLGFRVVLPSRAALAIVAEAAHWSARLGLLRILARVGGARGRALAAQPPFPPRHERRALPALTAGHGDRTGAVMVLQGCVQRELYGRVNRATVQVLAASGIDAHSDARHACCGALHAHNGDLEGAKELARDTIERLGQSVDEEGRPLPIVVNSAGCGAHMKEYGRLLADDPAWADRAATFASRVQDLSECLATPGRRERLTEALDPLANEGCSASWDAPCHLCHGQQVRDEPLHLLNMIPGLELRPLDRPEACCGSAGIHALLHPEPSAALLDEKLADLERAGGQTLVTANPGCQMHWESGLRRSGSDRAVRHLAEVLADSLKAEHRG